MNCPDLSDLEEGEILECDTFTPSESKDEHLGNGNNSNGYINKRLKEKLKINENTGGKSNIIADLESISSEEEYKSDENEYSENENDYYVCCNGDRRKRKEHLSQCYGTVEDIMSEIGETICRKSRCNYKKRKSKEQKIINDKYSGSTYNLWRHKIFSSHLKCKNQKRKVCLCHSDSDLIQVRTEKRRKRKRRDYDEEEKTTKKLKFRDFDEMRLNLLEKLKKQKAEEVLKESNNEPQLEADNSEIQEVDMLIDCTNYLDNPPGETQENTTTEDKEGEDDLDLVKLRLIALASNKRRKEVSSDISASETSVGGVFTEKKEIETQKEEGDLDRNELLLRAEALKTALLKKYQRRLNRLKIEKPKEVEENDGNSSPPETEESVKHSNVEDEKLDADACKENVKSGNESGSPSSSEVPSNYVLQPEVENKKLNETTNANTKKVFSRGKSKRKKRKPVLSTNNLKENNEKNETVEEDDRMLRTQLLSDLMKKKCLKDQEKKSVLMDSSQSTVNKPAMAAEPPMENLKPLPVVKKNFLKKVNVPRTTKPVVAPNFPKPDIQRIIVHLGSEDSSDDDVPPTECQTHQEETTQQENGSATATSSSDGCKQKDEMIQASYERSVELLLSQARKKIEGEKRNAANTFATPEAVYKHLPPSQRLEYIRLKQKIAERERLRNQKKENTLNSSATTRGSSAKEIPGKVAKVNENNSKPTNSTNLNFPKSEVVRNLKTITGGGIVGGKGKGLGTIKNNGPRMAEAAATERSFLLLPSSQALITKLKLLLRKIKMEKMIEENYEKEMSKLKNQLSLLEKKKCSQGLKIKKLWEESMKTYKAIQGMTGKSNEKVVAKEEKQKNEKEDEKLAKEKEQKKIEVEKTVVENKERTNDGENEKRSDNVENVAEEREKRTNDEDNVAEKQEQRKDEEEGKNVSDEPESELCKAQSKSGTEVTTEEEKLSETKGLCPLKYDSPLQAFTKVSDGTGRVDPNVMMCQFDLMGVCKDEDCAYQHLRILAK